MGHLSIVPNCYSVSEEGSRQKNCDFIISHRLNIPCFKYLWFSDRLLGKSGGFNKSFSSLGSLFIFRIDLFQQ